MFIFTIFFIVVIFFIVKTFIVVPQQYVYIKERLGVPIANLEAGFHFLIPIIEKVKYRQILKEVAIDVRPQVCTTKDNVQVEVDGILYLQVIDPYKASYGIDNFHLATEQLAQTTLRSEIGRLMLNQTFSERDTINSNIVKQIDEATDPWGIKVNRYEIRNIQPPKTIILEMENQMKAERERRAEIITSEGEREARINRSMGERQEAINLSEGDKMKLVNEANGKAQEIELIAEATSNGLRSIADAISKPGGRQAVQLQITQEYLAGLGNIFTKSKTTILPESLANIKGVFEGISKVTSTFPGDSGSQSTIINEPKRKG
ncbi:SPFH domain-containing protein [Leptospira sp. GIMC2001]|uniref:SPFH domain-containing protein n=1 Tax=Leptospira sp. GIMC2001 TaxID=1513297 RepID=UPI00234BAE45|nr:stomatin-like protein [Leptospira sp. GIMC2001]WCL47866.1 paraslipin [Leptospira sp. GIMC2001]